MSGPIKTTPLSRLGETGQASQGVQEEGLALNGMGRPWGQDLPNAVRQVL